MIAEASTKDLERWKREGREDILREYERIRWAGDQLVSITTGRHIHECPFLQRGDPYATCTIYDSRPGVCRNYEPGSSELCAEYEKQSDRSKKEGIS
jgi:Fe-S-cluster containining protein